MTDQENPWRNMGASSQRRVTFQSPHDIFWVIDPMGRYGFSIVTKGSAINTQRSLVLNGVKLVRQNLYDGGCELLLILNNTEDWNIFLALCKDLVEAVLQDEDQKNMIDSVQYRLRRWQQLLRQKRGLFTLEQQMGLYAELMCLKNVVLPMVGNVREAITSWVGPDFDKQDFLTANAVIEVKSHRTSVGENVVISSADQLSSPKTPFYLFAYGLTNADAGDSVAELSEQIREQVQSEPDTLLDTFDSKLIQYGYIPELLTEPLQRFVVDSVRVFEISPMFPRIVTGELPPQITSVRYTIDVSMCKEFELNYGDLSAGEV